MFTFLIANRYNRPISDVVYWSSSVVVVQWCSSGVVLNALFDNSTILLFATYCVVSINTEKQISIENSKGVKSPASTCIGQY